MDVILPALPIPNLVLLPGCTVTLQLGPPGLQRQLELAASYQNQVCLASDLNPNYGCLAEVRALHRNATGIQVKLAGVKRMRLFLELRKEEGLLWVGGPLPDLPFEGALPELRVPPAIAELRGRVPVGLWLDMAASQMPLSHELKEALLAEPDPARRLALLAESSPQRPAARRQLCFN